MQKKTLPVTGMSCASCAVSVESMLKHTVGVGDAGVNYANQSAWVEYDPAITSLVDLDHVLHGIGYGFIIEDDENDAVAEQEKIQAAGYQKLKTKTLWTGIFKRTDRCDWHVYDGSEIRQRDHDDVDIANSDHIWPRFLCKCMEAGASW